MVLCENACFLPKNTVKKLILLGFVSVGSPLERFYFKDKISI